MDAVELYSDRNHSEENIETNMEDDGLLKDEAVSSPDKIDRQENGATNQLTGRCTYRLEMVLAMYMISNIMTFPIAQFYVYNQVAKSYGIPNYIQDDNSDICHSKNISNETQAISNIQKEATEQLTYMSFLSSFLAIIPTFFIGYISDRFGRKISFLITIFGLLLHQIIYILVFVLEAPLPFLYIGSALEGLTGYISCAIMTAFIMLADITSPGKERAFRIAVMEGVLASSSALSVLGVGFWIKYSAFLIPMLCSTGLCVVTIIVWIVFVPETRPFVIDQNHERSKFKVLNFNIIKRCFVFYYQDSPEKRRGEMSTLLLILVLAASCLLSKSNVTTLFLLNTPLCWTELHITVVTSLQILVNWVAGILFLRLLQRVMRDVSMLTLGCFVGMVSMVPMALAKQDWMVYLCKSLIQIHHNFSVDPCLIIIGPD